MVPPSIVKVLLRSAHTLPVLVSTLLSFAICFVDMFFTPELLERRESGFGLLW